MELIRKSDAMHAVLHNQGDAAVAAVQGIKPINPHGELREILIDEIIDKGEWQDEQRGRWIYAKCNLCGKVQDVRSNYCPNCGAKMKGEDNTVCRCFIEKDRNVRNAGRQSNGRKDGERDATNE